MKRMLKKSACLLTAAALSATMVALPAAAEEAHAAMTPHMRKIGVKFDLKKNKAVSIKTAWPGIGFRDVTVRIKNYKVTKAKKKGYKTATFTLVTTQKTTLTKKQLAKTDIDAGVGTYWGSWWASFVDLDTGKSLNGRNNLGVTVKFGKPKRTGVKKYKLDYVTLNIASRCTQKVTVTFPSKYKGLCFGLFGDNCGFSETPQDDSFHKGKTPFGKTSYYNWKVANKLFEPMYEEYTPGYSQWFYKKSKTNSHWMRIK